MTVVAIIVNSIYYLYSRVKYPESRFRKYWNPNLAKEITSYSGWNIFGAIANVLRSQGINILINMFFSPAINAARGLAYQVSGALNMFASNFYTAVRPQVTKKYAAGKINETNNLIFSSSRVSDYFSLFLAVSIIVYIHPILQIWLVDIPQYTELFVSLVIIVALIDSLSNPLMTLVQASGRVKTYQIVVSVLLIMNLPISWVLLKIGFPAEYTMYTAIAISLILLFARVLILKRMVDFPAGSYFASVLSKVLLSTLLCFAGSIPTRFFIFDYTTGKFIHLASCVCLSVVLNMVVIYLAGLNRSERTMMRSFIESKIRQK
jgi:O-antigen/teichoic acid export membrane protein